MSEFEAKKEAPKDPTAVLGQFMPDAEKLGVDGDKITKVFEKLALLSETKVMEIDTAEAKKPKKIAALDQQIRPLKIDEDVLYAELETIKKQGDDTKAVEAKISKVKAKLDPLREERGKWDTEYNAAVYDKMMPDMKKAIASGGPANVTLLASTEKSLKQALGGAQKPGPTAFANELTTILNEGSEADGGLNKKHPKLAEKFFNGATQEFTAFEKRVNAIDKAFTDLTAAISKARS